KLNKSIETEKDQLKKNDDSEKDLEKKLVDIRTERATLSRQMAREIMRDDTKESLIVENYQPLLDDCDARIEGIQNQILLNRDKRNTVIRVNRIAKEAISIIDEILNKEKLDKNDLEFIIDKIYVYEDHIHVKLKDDIECILKSGTLADKPAEEAVNFNSDVISILNTEKIVQSAKNHRPDKVYDVSVISNGDPLEIYTDREGEVIFKKYSPIGEMAPFASQYAETLYRTCGFPVAVCDRDAVIACFGVPKKDLLDKKLSPELERIMEQHGVYVEEERRIYPTADGGTAQISAAMPIRSEGGICGCIMSLDPGGERSGRGVSRDAEQKLIQTAGTFLGRQFDA
ncbi:MAG: stage V sporulation protein T, partial [Clostridia bacterium]|nr:stage V sporulation protein T [Clostridia bacterium]